MKSVSVVIPTYNGKNLLEKNLPALMRAAGRHTQPVEIIVVDDASSDGSVEYLRERFPEVTVLANERNAGFAETMNRGIAVARHELVLALNNDILVEDDLFSATVARFADPAVFSVTPNIIDPARQESQSITRLKPGICWYRAINLQPAQLPDLAGEIPLFFGSGGASFYDREKLALLGGFDTIYHPFYVEDVDLSYRAWKCGWKCLFEPAVTVFHETSSTILNLHRKRKIKLIGDRNRTLFLWLNITDLPLIARYFLLLPFSLLYDIFAFRKYKFAGFFMALPYLPRIASGRRRRKALFRMTDREVIGIIRHRDLPQ
ncbi:MAG TPA: glycosyltransferase family 2 protein [Geobacteraceae bacterium]